MTTKYDAKGRPYIEQNWYGLTDVPDFLVAFQDLDDPGSGTWILTWDGDTGEWVFELPPT